MLGFECIYNSKHEFSMKCPRLKTIAVFILFAYFVSIVITYYQLYNAHGMKPFGSIRPGLVNRQRKSHRRPEHLRIGHPLFDSCLHDGNYENLILKPYFNLGNIYVYSAFLDNRTGEPYARMISMINTRAERPISKLWCHFSYGNNSPLDGEEPVEFYEMCENHHFSHGGWILSCKIPVKILKHTPCVFFIKETRGYSQNQQAAMIPLLKTSSQLNVKGHAKFGVCVPPLHGTITPFHLIKYMALTNALGIYHLIFYVHNITTELSAVLEYLEDRGTVTIIPWALPMDSNHVWYYGQSVAINDCLYRSMLYFRYVAFTDLDEYIVPHTPKTSLLNIMEHKQSTDKKIAAFRFSSAFFIRNPEAKGAQEEVDVLDHIYRTRGVSKIRSKVIVEPFKIFEVGIHHVSRTWPDDMQYTTLQVDKEEVIVHHYRACTPTLDLSCSSYITDSTVPDWFRYYFATRFDSRVKELSSALTLNITY